MRNLEKTKMGKKFHINQSTGIPLYKQVVSHIEQQIISGEYEPGLQLPSMNDLAEDLDISRETVKKAYMILRNRDMIEPKQGKGFYVKGLEKDRALRILLLFDKLSSYKQELFDSFRDNIGSEAKVTIRIHEKNLDVFELFIDEGVDNFDYYVVTPHFEQDSTTQKRMLKLLRRFPNRKLILLDHNVPQLPGNYGVVYQDFSNDIKAALSAGMDRLRKYTKLNVVIMPNSLYGHLICKSVEGFCRENSVPFEIHNGVSEAIIRKGEAYLMLNSQHDTGLITFAREAEKSGLKIGEDVGVISYNDSPLNEIILNGLTSVSADFKQMGKLAAEMILSKSMSKVKCNFNLVIRNTF